jgi:hypothetical protein
MRRDEQKAVVHIARQQRTDKIYIGCEYRFEYFGEDSQQASELEHAHEIHRID